MNKNRAFHRGVFPIGRGCSKTVEKNNTEGWKNQYLGVVFCGKNYSEFLIIFAFVRKCRFSLELQAFPTFSVVEDTPHISAFFSLTSQSKVVKR